MFFEDNSRCNQVRKQEHNYYWSVMSASLASDFKAKYNQNYAFYNNIRWTPGLDLLQNLNGSFNPLVSNSMFFNRNNKYDYRSFISSDTKSCVDTFLSKMATTTSTSMVFAPIAGSTVSQSVLKQATDFLQFFWKKQNVNSKRLQALAYACIFDIGWLYFNPVSRVLEVLLPWQVRVLNSEYQYGQARFSRSVIDYPVLDYQSLCRLYPLPEIVNAVKPGQFTFNLKLYFDLSTQTIEFYIDFKLVHTVPWAKSRCPLYPIFFNQPLLGLYTTSLVDNVINIQRVINLISGRAAKCLETSIWQKYFIAPSVTEPQMSNLIGEFIRAVPGESQKPVEKYDPSPLDSSVMPLLQEWRELLFSTAGLDIRGSTSGSSTAATASAITRQTAENLQQARFQRVQDCMIRSSTELVDMLLDIVDRDESIFPSTSGYRGSFTWGQVLDLKDQSQFIYENTLLETNDPATRVQRLKDLADLNLVPRETLLANLDIPDISRVSEESAAPVKRYDLLIDLVIEGVEIPSGLLKDLDPDEYFERSVIRSNLIRTSYFSRPDFMTKALSDLYSLDLKVAQYALDMGIYTLPPAPPAPPAGQAPAPPVPPAGQAPAPEGMV